MTPLHPHAAHIAKRTEVLAFANKSLPALNLRAPQCASLRVSTDSKMGWLSRGTVNKPKQERLTLQDWLSRAGIPQERIPTLLGSLDEHWIGDVPSLLRAVPVLEKHLPAAAFQLISRAALAEQVMHATSASCPSNICRSSDTTSDEFAPAAGGAGAGLYASPVKFSDGPGFDSGCSTVGSTCARRCMQQRRGHPDGYRYLR